MKTETQKIHIAFSISVRKCPLHEKQKCTKYQQNGFVYHQLPSLLQILPWTGPIMPCGGPKRTFGWTIPDGPQINTISPQMRFSNSHRCTKPSAYNCPTYAILIAAQILASERSMPCSTCAVSLKSGIRKSYPFANHWRQNI